jgi:hypothetical protein
MYEYVYWPKVASLSIAWVGVDFTAPHRLFIKDGCLTKTDRHGIKRKHSFLLFNDLMCYGDKIDESTFFGRYVVCPSYYLVFIYFVIPFSLSLLQVPFDPDSHHAFYYYFLFCVFLVVAMKMREEVVIDTNSGSRRPWSIALWLTIRWCMASRGHSSWETIHPMQVLWWRLLRRRGEMLLDSQEPWISWTVEAQERYCYDICVCGWDVCANITPFLKFMRAMSLIEGKHRF